MITSYTLDEKDIRLAIHYWLREVKKVEPKDNSCYMWEDMGDPPLSGKSYFAKVEIKG